MRGIFRRNKNIIHERETVSIKRIDHEANEEVQVEEDVPDETANPTADNIDTASRTESNIERVSRVLMPSLYVIFNLAYFLYYTTDDEKDYDKLCQL